MMALLDTNSRKKRPNFQKHVMNEKIIQFLADAGFEGSTEEPVALQLLRYFEAEYDVSLLPLLEKEWVDEQIERELTEKHFESLYKFTKVEFETGLTL